jgi:hypothetical protein
MATSVCVCIAAVLNMMYSAAFSNIIIGLFAFVVGLCALATDIYRPAFLSLYFAFLRFQWGRALLFLLLGALVIRNEGFSLFAGIFAWGVALTFLVFFFLTFCNRSPASQTGAMDSLAKSPETISPMKS